MNEIRYKLACVAFAVGVVVATIAWNAGERIARGLS